LVKAIEPFDPLFCEDPLHPSYGEGWLGLKRSTRVPLLIGEKLELVRGFKPFLDNQVADIIHPDLAFAGGLTGTKKIADYATLFRTPVALHNVGSLVQTYAGAHFGSAIHNFYRSESLLGMRMQRAANPPAETGRGASIARHLENMSKTGRPEVKSGQLGVPDGAGLGFEPNDDYLRSQLAPGEPFWS
jgi:L-alanine-DL-glutamate epimerase-like enolase superfamily enzyme